MFTLAEDGKVNKKGMPNPMRLAVIARHHFDDVRLPFPPAWLQRLGLAFGAPLGRLLGYKPTYQAQVGLRRLRPRSASEPLPLRLCCVSHPSVRPPRAVGPRASGGSGSDGLRDERHGRGRLQLAAHGA